MDYNFILNEIKPTLKEQEEVKKISSKLITFLEKICQKENIEAKISLVGSVAKGTYLRGKSDIDIFIAFPLDTNNNYLKKTGLYLAHKCSDNFNGDASHHFASHPYVTSIIDGFEVDFVPCFEINDGSQLKSAVDRTILHTKYVKANLTDLQKNEVLLLKKFMDMTKTYGSEFKVGGFAGYLCELLIIHYGSFENTLKNASKWKYGHTIDLEDYGTSVMFNDSLIVIDPTDKNRNVGASLRVDKMSEFIQSARNYLNSSNKQDYFYPLKRNLNEDNILNNFKKRNSEFIVIKFKIPNIPLDTLHPQIRKTAISLKNKLNEEEFNVFQVNYWTDEKSVAVILLEMASSRLNAIKVHYGPKIFISNACRNFTNKYGVENCYIMDDFLVCNQKREFINASDLIKHIFTPQNINLIKFGKNLKRNILNTYSFIDVSDLTDNQEYLEFLDDFLNPGQHILR